MHQKKINISKFDKRLFIRSENKQTIEKRHQKHQDALNLKRSDLTPVS